MRTFSAERALPELDTRYIYTVARALVELALTASVILFLFIDF